MAERKWVEVKSSRLSAVDFDPITRSLFVRFNPDRNGDMAVYQYANVEPAVFQGLVEADSHGRYFNENIKSRATDYPYTKIGSERKGEDLEPTAA